MYYIAYFIFRVTRSLRLWKYIPDEMALRILYRVRMKKKLNLKDPKTFNEKLQWLKLNNRNPEYTAMVDKHGAKEYVAEKIGEEYIIPTLGVWEAFDDIDFDALPEQFVLKCTHDSGGLVICRDKSKLDLQAAKAKIKRSYKRNYFYGAREWPYKNVKPRIIAEQYMDLISKGGAEYKLFCFNGKPKIILVCMGEAHSATGRTNDFLDENFVRLPVKSLNPNSPGELECPEQMPEMKRIAEYLSKDIPVLRVDFYLVEGKIYFGELTFFHNSGMCKFEPEEYDRIFGDMIELPNKQ